MDQALLAAVLAHPEDDAPRLVLADWLSQRDDPRGELIVLACALANGSLDDDARGLAEARKRELMAKHELAWISPLGTGITPNHVKWARGFVEHVILPWSQMATRWRELIAQTPMTSFRTYQLTHADLRDLAAVSWPATITSMSLYAGGVDAEGAAIVASSSQLGHLTHLDLGLNRLENAGAAAIVSSSAVAHLRSLDLFGNHLTASGAGAFATARFDQLESLRLQQNELGDEDAETIANSDCMTHLTSLSLVRNAIGPAGATALALSSQLGSLRGLQLSINQLGPEGARAIVASTTLRKLSYLDLSANAIGSDGARAFADAYVLDAVRSLDLQGNSLGTAGVEQLVAMFRSLTWLNLSFNQLDLRAATILAAAPLDHLGSLNLRNNPLGPVGVRAIVTAPCLKELRVLLLDEVELGDRGAVELATSIALPSLRELSLYTNGIDIHGARAIAASPYFDQLTSLRIGRNHFNNHAQKVLRDRFGDRLQL